MKKYLSVLLAIVMLAAVAVPSVSANDGGRYGRGGYGRGGWAAPREVQRSRGCPGCEFLGGLVLGGILGGVLGSVLTNHHDAAPPAYAPPQPYCYTQPGHWSQVPYSDGYFTRYQNVWAPPQTVCQ
jgi:hypothetical protein